MKSTLSSGNKKHQKGIERRREAYQHASFEVKINDKNQSLYLTFSNFERFCKATYKAKQENLEKFRFADGGKEWFLETGYAEFCINHYNNIPDDFDEALLEFEIKKKEQIEQEIKQEAYKKGLLRYNKRGGWQIKEK